MRCQLFYGWWPGQTPNFHGSCRNSTFSPEVLPTVFPRMGASQIALPAFLGLVARAKSQLGRQFPEVHIFEDLPAVAPDFFSGGASSCYYFPGIGASQIALRAFSRLVARAESQVARQFPHMTLGHLALGADNQIPEGGNSAF